VVLISQNYSTFLCRPLFSAAKHRILPCSFDPHRWLHSVNCNQYRHTHATVSTTISHIYPGLPVIPTSCHHLTSLMCLKTMGTCWDFLASTGTPAQSLADVLVISTTATNLWRLMEQYLYTSGAQRTVSEYLRQTYNISVMI